MPKVEKSIEITLPPEEVWAFITNPEKFPQQVKFNPAELTDGRLNTGTNFRIIHKVGGQKINVDCKITECVENKRLVFEGIAKGIKGFRMVYTAEPVKKGCRVTLEVDIELLGGFLGRMIRNAMSVDKRTEEGIGRILTNMKEALMEKK